MWHRLFLFDPSSWSDWQGWLNDQKATISQHGTRIIIIVVLLIVMDVIFRRLFGRVLAHAIEGAARRGTRDPIVLRRRAETLVNTINWAFGIFLLFLGSGLVLAELGLNVSALIAGVGVVGIALGLGAQTLVKDVLNGMFILLEDQYSVGDLVTVAGATGDVIEINPRRTVLRDSEGNIHSIPNSAITVAVNKTASLNRFKVEIEVPFDDSDRAIAAADAVGREVEDALGLEVLTAPHTLAERVGSGGHVQLTIVGEARPAQRWHVEAEYRRRLRQCFETEGIQATFGNGVPAPAPA